MSRANDILQLPGFRLALSLCLWGRARIYALKTLSLSHPTFCIFFSVLEAQSD